MKNHNILNKINCSVKIKKLLSFSFFLLGIAYASTEPNIATTPVDTIPVGTTPVISTNTSQEGDKGVSASIQEDSMLGIIGQIRSFLSLNDSNAVAAEFDAGPRVWRANGTYGLALNDNNRVKLTAEYLREDLDFSFYTGDTRQWVGQSAIGAAYQYGLLDSGWLKNLNIGGHYSNAPGKDLSTQTITSADGSTITDYRHIAGGQDLNGNADADMQLWKDSLLTVGPDYDRVRYNTKYNTQNGQDAQGWGGHAYLEQRLKHNLSLELNTALSQVYDIYGAGLNWVWLSNTKTSLSTGINSSYTQDRAAERNFWVNALTLNVVWDPPQAQNENTAKSMDAKGGVAKGGVALPVAVAPDPLPGWVQTPAVRMPDVLAVADERITVTPSTPLSVPTECPAGIDVVYVNGQYQAPGGWYQFYPAGSLGPTTFPIALDSSNVMGTPGPAACLYILQGQAVRKLILENPAYQKVQWIGSSWYLNQKSFYWPSSEPTPAAMCPATRAECQFQSV